MGEGGSASSISCRISKASRTEVSCGPLPLQLLTGNVFIEVEMAINAEFSDYTVITEADPIFIVAEVLFCIFFTVELVIRCLLAGQESTCRHRA